MNEKQLMNRQIAKTVYKEGWHIIWTTDFFGPEFKKWIKDRGESKLDIISDLTHKNDIQIILEDPKGKRVGDAVCHYGSYGCSTGLWETMIDGIPDVTGYLTFDQVLKQFNSVIRSYNKKHGKKTPATNAKGRS